ncbi:YHS domain-containing (seleno)protein [Pseudorhodoplanes sp.]|uniref:YHS domain-containing (seleno)protein n=1 Tax=Pseudorhodoplanes sp. TaxID=1934341 RepID=UPI002BDBD748|nr:YHS domain-containing (seleno)protein [Pseudorhodoplanes sp.]HWV52688.1 YHS domain-containing (seleno)protein [Pseudorhodoplanes sp.]
MTTLRRQRLGVRLAMLWLLFSGAPAVVLWQAGYAATTEQIVTDHNTGLAIYGYDPVAYFTDGAPKMGREHLEVKHAGVAWRFHNEGNRDAFARDPDVYMPQYGGYDPIAISSNIARPGHPDFWAIHNDRLFLFYSEDARKQFRADPGQAALQAEVNWPHVSQSLVP